MTERTDLFLAAIGLFVLALAALALYFYRRRKRAMEKDWEGLLSKLRVIDRISLAEVALDVIDESGERRTDEGCAILEPEQIWDLIGGYDGLEMMLTNCTVLIDLASYVQIWYPDALLVAEQLRQSAREIEWSVKRLQNAARTGKLESSFSMYAQPAAATYYLMTRRLLTLYERGQLPMLADLQKAI